MVELEVAAVISSWPALDENSSLIARTFTNMHSYDELELHFPSDWKLKRTEGQFYHSLKII